MAGSKIGQSRKRVEPRVDQTSAPVPNREGGCCPAAEHTISSWAIQQFFEIFTNPLCSQEMVHVFRARVMEQRNCQTRGVQSIGVSRRSSEGPPSDRDRTPLRQVRSRSREIRLHPGRRSLDCLPVRVERAADFEARIPAIPGRGAMQRNRADAFHSRDFREQYQDPARAVVRAWLDVRPEDRRSPFAQKQKRWDEAGHPPDNGVNAAKAFERSYPSAQAQTDCQALFPSHLRMRPKHMGLARPGVTIQGQSGARIHVQNIANQH